MENDYGKERVGVKRGRQVGTCVVWSLGRRGVDLPRHEKSQDDREVKTPVKSQYSRSAFLRLRCNNKEKSISFIST